MKMQSKYHKPLFILALVLIGVTSLVVLLSYSLSLNRPVNAQGACVQPPSGMVSWWPGDGNANDIIGGNPGTLLGGTFFTAAKVGQGFTFDSDDDRVTIPHNANLNVNSPGFTAEFWMQGVKNQPQSLYVPVDKSHGFVDNTGWVFQGDSTTGELGFLIGAGGGPPFTNFPGVGSGDVLDGNFHHIAGAWDGSTIRLYVDGVLQGTASLTTPFNNTRALNIGFAAGGGSPQRFFRGKVDELGIYNRALSASEIQAIVSAGSASKCKPACVTAPSGIVGWWSGDGNANDLQGTNPGTLLNGVTFASGQVEQAFSFNGATSYISAPFTQTGPFTVDLWAKANATNQQAFTSVLSSGRPNHYDRFFQIEFDGSGNYQFEVGNPELIVGIGPATTIFQHIAVTYDGSVVKTYLNGQLSNSGTWTGPPISFEVLKIGINRGENFSFNGLIDEVEVFNRALSASEIQTIANAGSGGKCKPSCTPSPTGLKSWWPGDGNANDIIGGNPGALLGGTFFTAAEVGQGFTFDSDDDRVTIPHNANLNINSPGFTAEFWMRGGKNQPQTIYAPVEKSHGYVDNTGWVFQGISATGEIDFLIGAGGGAPFTNFPGIASTVDVLDGSFHHIAGTWDGSTIRLYVDGVLQGTASLTTPFNNTRTLNIGFAAGGGTPQRFFRGKVDELSIYNRPLSASEIQAIVHADSAGHCKNRPPVAVCQSVTVSAEANCTASASINNGSSDPDGDTITFTQSPPGPYPLGATSVTMTVTDSKGASSSCAATVTVVDTTPPQVTPPVNASYQCLSQVPPGNPSQATATDNCSTPTITVADAGNGGAGSIASPLVITRYFTATDAAGKSASAPQTITVIDNTPPVPNLAALPDVTGQCSATISAAPTATDNCRGSVIGTTSDPLSYNSQGTFIVTWTYDDGNGNRSTQTQRVTVRDTIAPTIATANKMVNTDPNLCSAAVAHGTTASDNCALASLAGVRSDGALLTAPYPKGMTTISWTATDQAGNTSSATQTITVVDNQNPVIACPANISVAGNIPGSCSANVSVVAPAAADNCGATVSGSRSDGQALSAPYPLGVTTITWTATDAAGNQASCLQQVTVTNPNPVVAITGPTTGSVYAVGAAVNFTGSFTDNAGGTHTATWSFDAITQTGTVNEMTGAVTATYTFTSAGVYQVTLTVADGCGGSGAADTIDGLSALVVIYDPGAGWVTGGGWINSPAGAYAPNPSLTGRANFGFVSKYQNGASVPTGNTEFHFKAGDLKFKSTSYEWMVIAGKKAQYKGFGTINGSGSYRFMLTAIDGDQPGGGGQDKFRIRIWSDGGGLVYDNQMNDPDSNDPTTVLGGGSIVIHR